MGRILCLLALVAYASAFRPAMPPSEEFPAPVSRMSVRTRNLDNENARAVFLSAVDDSGARTYTGYTSPEGVVAAVTALNGTVPGFVVRVGASERGREILGFRFSACPAGCADRPLIVLIGDIHGDEVVGGEVLLRFLAEMKHLHESPAAPNYYAAHADIVVVPMFNPDGFVAGTRTTARVADLNRSFRPDRCGTAPLPAEPVPEAEAMKTFLRGLDPDVVLVLHGGATVVSYPYDDECTSHGSRVAALTPENALLVQLSHAYADANGMIRGRVINGAQWYSLSGGLQDWVLANTRALVSLTAELSSVKWPAYERIDAAYWPSNRPALHAFLHAAQRGAHVTVVNEHGQPVAGASVGVHAQPDRKSVLTRAGGYAFRALPDGETTIVVRAPGYADATRVVTISDSTPEVHWTQEMQLHS